jgi:hypothetical protein
VTAVAPETTLSPRRTSRQSRPVPVRSLPAELLDVDLDVVYPEDEPETGPSADFLLRCSWIFGGIVAAALLAGEIMVHLV